MTDPIQQATTMIHCGQWDTAAGILYQVLADDADNITALALMAVCKWQAHATDSAEAVALQLIRTAPDNPTGHYLLAQIRLYRGAPAQALSAVRRCLHCNPNNADALKLCVDIQRRLHDWSGARDTRRYLQLVHPERAVNDTLWQRARRWRTRRRDQTQPCLQIFCQAA